MNRRDAIKVTAALPLLATPAVAEKIADKGSPRALGEFDALRLSQYRHVEGKEKRIKHFQTRCQDFLLEKIYQELRNQKIPFHCPVPPDNQSEIPADQPILTVTAENYRLYCPWKIADYLSSPSYQGVSIQVPEEKLTEIAKTLARDIKKKITENQWAIQNLNFYGIELLETPHKDPTTILLFFQGITDHSKPHTIYGDEWSLKLFGRMSVIGLGNAVVEPIGAWE